MVAQKYITNIAQDVVYVDDNTIAVKTSSGSFRLKGMYMATAVNTMLEQFKEPAIFDAVEAALSDKYSRSSLQKLMSLLVGKGLLITEDSAATQESCDKELLEKAFFYTSGGLPLREVMKKLGKMHIGVIGTNQIVQCLLDEFSNSDLFNHFHINIVDGDENIENAQIVKDSQFVIVASNYPNHYMFEEINRLCIAENKSWLRIQISGAIAEVGPHFIPGKTCCYTCLHSKTSQNIFEDEYVFDDLLNTKKCNEENIGNRVKFNPLYPLNTIAASIAVSEAIRYHVGMKHNLQNQVLTIEGVKYNTDTGYVYKDNMCQTCAILH